MEWDLEKEDNSVPELLEQGPSIISMLYISVLPVGRLSFPQHDCALLNKNLKIVFPLCFTERRLAMAFWEVFVES